MLRFAEHSFVEVNFFSNMVPHNFLWFNVGQQIFGSLIISYLKIFLVDPIYLIDKWPVHWLPYFTV